MVLDLANFREAYLGALRLQVGITYLKLTSLGVTLAQATLLGARTLGGIGNIDWRVVETTRLSSFKNKSFKSLQFFSVHN